MTEITTIVVILKSQMANRDATLDGASGQDQGIKSISSTIGLFFRPLDHSSYYGVMV